MGIHSSSGSFGIDLPPLINPGLLFGFSKVCPLLKWPSGDERYRTICLFCENFFFHSWTFWVCLVSLQSCQHSCRHSCSYCCGLRVLKLETKDTGSYYTKLKNKGACACAKIHYFASCLFSSVLSPFKAYKLFGILLYCALYLISRSLRKESGAVFQRFAVLWYTVVNSALSLFMIRYSPLAFVG